MNKDLSNITLRTDDYLESADIFQCRMKGCGLLVPLEFRAGAYSVYKELYFMNCLITRDANRRTKASK